MNTTWPTVENVELVKKLTGAILAAADPSPAVARFAYTLPSDGAPISLLAVGKAAVPMATSALDTLGDRVVRSLVFTTEHLGAKSLSARCEVLVGDHPLATPRNVEGSRRVVEYLRDPSGKDHLLLILLSGGGSALITLPAQGLALEDITRLSSALMRRGCAIDELNCVRKHCELSKGGRLAALSSAMRIKVCLVSDVIGDPLSVIASGPFAPDPTTFDDAMNVLLKFDAVGESESITQYLRTCMEGAHKETPKPGDPLFDRVTHDVVLSNTNAVEAAVDALSELGYSPATLRAHTGEAKDAAKQITLTLGEHDAVVMGGEPIVSGIEDGSVGGPMQEAVLAAALELERDLFDWLVFGLATDGRDGPTDAAGAAIDRRMLRRAREAGVALETSLNSHNTHPVLADMGALIRTGPTGTNINDVLIAIRR